MKLDFWVAAILAAIMVWAIALDMYQLGLSRACKTYEFWTFVSVYVACCVGMYLDNT